MMSRPKRVGLLVVGVASLCLVLVLYVTTAGPRFMPYYYRPPCSTPGPLLCEAVTTTSGRITPTSTPDPCEVANMTVVSGFFDIGDHGKGGGRRKISEYFEYSASLAYLHSPLVFYTDSEAFASYFTKLRARLDPKLTTVIRVNRDALWPFNLKSPIATLYSKPGYPKHQPNTVVPEYSCAQHAKYACILDLVLKRPDIPRTDVYAWLDFGYFRYLKDKKEYCLKLPPRFDRSRPSFNQVFMPNFALKAKTIYYRNHVWVGGGMFLAARDTIVTLCTEYQRATEYWLFRHNLSSTDQQNLYASFTEEGRRMVKFGVELNVDPGRHGWFQLGQSCLHLLPSQSNTTTTTITTNNNKDDSSSSSSSSSNSSSNGKNTGSHTVTVSGVKSP